MAPLIDGFSTNFTFSPANTLQCGRMESSQDLERDPNDITEKYSVLQLKIRYSEQFFEEAKLLSYSDHCFHRVKIHLMSFTL